MPVLVVRFWICFLRLFPPCSQNLLFPGMQVDSSGLLGSIAPPLSLRCRIVCLVLRLFVVILLLPYSDRFLFGCCVANCYTILQVPRYRDWEGSGCVSGKTKCAICAVGVFILCLFVIFITVVVFLR